jgi:hypothetical protein
VLSSDPGQPVSLNLGACGNYWERPKQLVDILNKLAKDQSKEGIELKLHSLETIDFILSIPPAYSDLKFSNTIIE